MYFVGPKIRTMSRKIGFLISDFSVSATLQPSAVGVIS